MAITRTQQARQMYKEGSMKPVKQAGVMNYMPSEMVTVPKIAKSSPDTPTAKLAYITPEEQNILIDLNLYGSLDGKPNRGPGGIPSLEGDFGSPTGSTYSGGSAGEDGGSFTGGGGDTPSPQLPPGVQKAVDEGRPTSIKTKEDERRAKKEVQEFLKSKNLKVGGGQKTSFLDKLKKVGLPTQKLLYGAFPNNPKTELRYLADLKFRNPQAFAELPQELKDILAETEDPANEFSSYKDFDKLSYDDFKSLTNFQPTDGMNFAEYAATYAGSPGLLYSGNVGNLEKFVKGVDEFGRTMYGYRQKTGDDGPGPRTESDLEKRLRLLEEQNKQLQQASTTSTLPMFRFMNRGGMVEDAPMGGIMDLETTRQMLFIGGVAKSIGKGLKSITRGVKKVAKSPLGKAALLGAVGFGIPGTQFGGLFGRASFGGAAKGFFGSKGIGPLISSKFSDMTLPKLITDNMGGLKVAALSGLGGALLASLENKDDDEFDIEEYYRMAGIDIPENQYRFLAEGGSTEKEPVAKKTMPLLDLEGQEMDFRQDGGFVPIGRMEKADDVPARLSKNEFVFTAEAVRNAGGGDVDKGAEVMYNTMKNLEAGGEVSEETQGLEGARKMFQTSQRLGEVV